ncbi:alpha/beta hydrolase [Rhodococcus sp. PAMC28707]|uniref:alpha/beta fold hydrolase n=1 Tax=unclassified Rhodococcus (in: high G+C Gram-positive bacteria) TaxID=192944 RepID=UPI00109DD7ED|nr:MULTISPECIES: alpha/beta hydrolase [unclassified Rhodococcus (in: high G+C Gram-positive bacteria)]QCB51268.1 alpha/beta hydrolase [Rhodococcus sp. PAMC28705]QCB60564.1 alpha/beta hydrolase [Rhodococcus sp. PAMC28707]
MDIEAEFKAGAAAKGGLLNPRATWVETTVVTADGAKIHVRSFGPADAQPIVLIHGFACRLEYWNPQINRFRDQYRVIAYDQRGLGRSTLGRAGVNPKVLGDDLAAVLEATVSPKQPAVLVGHSFGGITIMAWAEGHPEQVRTLASAALLANTVAARFRATTGVMPFAGRYGAIRAPLLSLVMRARLSVPAGAPISRAVRAIAMSPQATLAQADFLRAMVTSVPTGIRNEWGEGLFKLDVLEGLEKLHIPCTVLVGALDRLTPPEAGRVIEAVLRRRGVLHRYVELEKVGHCSNLQAAEAFDDEIVQLLELSRQGSNAED